MQDANCKLKIIKLAFLELEKKFALSIFQFTIFNEG